MLASVALSAVLLLQLPLSTLQAPVRARTSFTSGERKVYTKRIPLPVDLDMNKMSLKQLLDLRPRPITVHDGDLYRHYFANHPQIKAIDLHDEKVAQTAAKLVALKDDGTHTTSSKKTLAASVDDLVALTEFESEEHRQQLIRDIKGARFRATRKAGYANHLAKGRKEEKKERRAQIQALFKQKHGKSMSTMSRKFKKENPTMNQPLSYHLDKDGVALTPKEAASKALSLRHLYSNPKFFTMKLEEYLKEKGAAQEDTDAVVGMQQLNVIREMKAKKGKEKEAAGPSSSTSNTSVSRTSGSRGSQQAVTPSTSLQSSVLSGVQQHQIPPQHLPATIPIQHDPPPPPHAHPHQADSIDINDKASWKLLEQFLQR